MPWIYVHSQPHTLEESETIAQLGIHVKLPIPGKKPSIPLSILIGKLPKVQSKKN